MKNTRSDVNLYDEIYHAAKEVLKSYEKFLNKTILSEHSHCIKRFSGLYKSKENNDFPEICPYAYAFVFWKESFYGINPFYNEAIPRKKKALRDVELPFYFKNESVIETINYLLRNYGDKLSVSSLLWIVRHMVWNIADSHFQEWTIIARDYASKSIRPKTKYDDFNYTDVFSFVFVDSKIELYISKEPDIGKVKIICPYRENKVIGDNEFSHLPMRLSINPGFINEKKAAEKYLAGLKILSR